MISVLDAYPLRNNISYIECSLESFSGVIIISVFFNTFAWLTYCSVYSCELSLSQQAIKNVRIGVDFTSNPPKFEQNATSIAFWVDPS